MEKITEKVAQYVRKVIMNDPVAQNSCCVFILGWVGNQLHSEKGEKESALCSNCIHFAAY